MNALEQIMRDEGFRSKPYVDSVGKITVGYGINLDNDPLSEAEGQMLTEGRVRKLIEQLSAQLPWTNDLDDARMGVLTNMAYNLGMGGLLGFKKTLALVQERNYEQASVEMLDSKWADQVGARAQRLSVQMRTGEWQ